MSKQKTNAAVIPEERIRRISLVVLCVVILIIALVRIRLAGVPLERDEGEYAYAGQLILQGVLPFVEVYNMKMPGIYAAYAVILAVLGQTATGIHLGLLVVNAASIVMLFVLAKRYFSQTSAAVAAISFGWLSLSSGVLGAFAHATQFVVFFGLAGSLLILRPDKSIRWQRALFSGLLFGVAFMMKQHAAPYIVVAGVYLLWRLIRDESHTPASRAAGATLFGIGVFTPFLLTCAAMWSAGVFDTFWFWTFDYAGAYVSRNSAQRIPTNLGVAIDMMIPQTFLMTLLALIGLGAMWKKKAIALFLSGLFVASAIAVSLGFFYRTHYFVLALPMVGVLIAVGAEWVAGRLPRAVAAGAFAPLLIAAIAWGQYVIADRAYLVTLSPVEVSRSIYRTNPFPESIEIARYLREHTQPNERIAVIGSEPQLCFYSQRRSVTGFAYIYPLLENQRFAREMQQQMISQVENGAPSYVVLVSVTTSWNPSRETGTPFMRWAESYVLNKCERVGLIDISMGGTAYYWDDQQEGRMPASRDWVGVFKLKENAAEAKDTDSAA